MVKLIHVGILIEIYGNLNICVKNKVHDNDGRLLILDATINGSDYLLINFYNANTEREQLTTIKNLPYSRKLTFNLINAILNSAR